MNSIDIRRPHALTLRQARSVIDTLASEFSERHGAGYRWEDNTLLFSRFGLRGSVDITSDEVHLRASLGFVYLSRRDALVNRVREFMDAHQDTRDPKAVLAAARRLTAVSPYDRPPPPAPKPSRSKAKAGTSSVPAPARDPSPQPSAAQARRSGIDPSEKSS